MEEEEPLNEATNEIIYNYTKNLVNNIKSNYQGTTFLKNGMSLRQGHIPTNPSTLPHMTIPPTTQIPKLLKDEIRRQLVLRLRDVNLVNIPKSNEYSLFQLLRNAMRRKFFNKAMRMKNLVNNRKFYRKRGSKLARKFVPVVTGHSDDGLSSEFQLPMEIKKLENKRKIAKSRKYLGSRNVATILNNLIVNDRNLRMVNYEGNWPRRQYVNKNKETKKYAYIRHDDDNDFKIRLNDGFIQTVYNDFSQKRFEVKNKSIVVAKDSLGLGKYINGKGVARLR